MAGALATTDAEGNDGSEAGVAKLAGAVAGEAAAASCCCLEHAASVKSNADDKTNAADFMRRLSKSSTRVHRMTDNPRLGTSRMSQGAVMSTGRWGAAWGRENGTASG